jgi:hypothetical protein
MITKDDAACCATCRHRRHDQECVRRDAIVKHSHVHTHDTSLWLTRIRMPAAVVDSIENADCRYRQMLTSLIASEHTHAAAAG